MCNKDRQSSLERETTVDLGPGSLPGGAKSWTEALDILSCKRPSYNVPGQLFAAFSSAGPCGTANTGPSFVYT